MTEEAIDAEEIEEEEEEVPTNLFNFLLLKRAKY